MVDNSKKLFLSQNCKDKCLAKSALKKSSTEGIVPSMGQTPGALICIRQFNAKAITLRNENGGESSFCQFSDNTMTESSRLFIAAQLRNQ